MPERGEYERGKNVMRGGRECQVEDAGVAEVLKLVLGFLFSTHIMRRFVALHYSLIN
jgi:hypothetical protein